MTDTMLGTENSKLRIFSFILEIQCMQPNFKTVTSRNLFKPCTMETTRNY